MGRMKALIKSVGFNSPKPNSDSELEKEKRNTIQAYIPKIMLYEVRAFNQEKASYDKTIVPAVTFKLQNNGDKTLSMVEVTIYFKDKNGKVIFEEKYHPISTNSWTSPSNPFKLGYIWQIERGRVYLASKVPSEWEEGSVSAKITDLEFLD